MTTTQRNKRIGQLLDAMEHTPHIRSYGVFDGLLLALAAPFDLWCATLDKEPTREDVTKFLADFRESEPSLFQTWRPSEKVKVEKLVDPLSGREPENPWVTNDVASQNALLKRNPQLAEQLKRRAKSGGVLTYAELISEEQAEQTAKLLRELRYSRLEHDQNPFRGTNISLQTTFRKQHGDAIADVYRREAETPVTLSWVGEGNMTNLNKMRMKNPKLYKLVQDSIPLAREWAQEELAECEKNLATQQARQKAARQVLDAKMVQDRAAWDKRVEKLQAQQ